MAPRRKPVDEIERDLGDRRWVNPQRIAVSKQGMVSTAHYRATEAAVSVMEDGGNAFDAAVAAAFALGVCEPAASGLGGQTMVLFYDAASRRKVALDGASRAPHRIEPGEMPKTERLRGHRATTVPSTPAVLAYLLDRYGTKPLAEVLEPSIRMAEEGVRVTQLQNFLAKREIKHLRANSAAPLFLRNGRAAFPVGSLFRQPVLANTLRRLAEAGIEDFYQGEIAKRIHEDMVANDGLIRDDDLAQIPWPVERRALSTKFENARLFTFGPPGAGQTLVQILNVLSEFPENKRDPDTPAGAMLLAEVIRKANLDRADRPYDPNLYPQEWGEDMTQPERAKRIARRLKRRLPGHGETTHLSVMDRAGNAVALTQSIERVFGSFAAAPGLGFLYNNYMSAFEYQDMAHPYYLRPNAVPWASVAPTIVFRGRRPWLAIGSPGSERIVSAIVQVMLRLGKQSPYDAVAAPRLHCSINGKVSLEASRMRTDTVDALRRRGFEIDVRDPYSFYLGCVQMVLRGQRGELIGIADPRRDGAAGGPQG